jgi:hypothetical protein
MHLKSYFLFILSIFSFLGESYSQQNITEDSPLFSEITFTSPSYVTITGGLGNLEPLVSEVNFSPDNIFFFDKNKKFGFELSPRMVFRSSSMNSFPIRTPSYMLKGTLFYKTESSLSSNLIIPFISLGHHSNGQDGNALNVDGSVNHLIGSFANNYATAGIMFLKPNIKHFNPFSTVRIYASYNHIDPQIIRNLYGNFRFNAEIESVFLINSPDKRKENNSQTGKSNLSGLIQLEIIGGQLIESDMLFSKRLIASYSLFYQPAFLGPFSIFTRVYFGQDYYNINFDRSLSVIQFGISMKDLKLWY